MKREWIPIVTAALVIAAVLVALLIGIWSRL